MRAAPPVSVRAAGGRAWRVAQTVLPALAAAALGTWATRILDVPAWPVAVLVLAAGAVAWRYSRPTTVALAWDGAQWTVDGAPARPVVTIDLGPWLLLRVARAAAAPVPVRWVAVAAGEAGPAWHALRCALYAAPAGWQHGAPDGAAG